MTSKDEIQKAAFDSLMKESKEMAKKAGNDVKFTEEQLRKHCEQIAHNVHKRRKLEGRE